MHIKMAEAIILRDSTEGKVSTPTASGWRRTLTTIITPCEYPVLDGVNLCAIITAVFCAARHIGSTAKPRREAGERTGGA
jgi:hypothetical protein